MSGRPLLPKPGTWQVPSGEPGPSRVEPKRSNVSIACNPCRRRKTKCDGRRPQCGPCITSQDECQYVVPTKAKPTSALKRRLYETSETNAQLRGVLEALHQSDETQATEIVQQLRVSSSIDVVIKTVSQLGVRSNPSSHTQDIAVPGRSGLDAAGSRRVMLPRLFDVFPDLETPSFPIPGRGPGMRRIEARDPLPPGHPGSAEMRETFGSGSFVIDIRSETLPVSKWTRILGTEQQFTHLLNLFWTWDNTLSRIVDREAFVHDLKAGANDPSTMDSIENCSPFLVNALLAVGSMYTRQSQELATKGDPTTRGQVYADEAARLLRDENPRPSVALIQGTALLWVYEANLRDGAFGLRLLEDVYSLYALFNFDKPGSPPDPSAGPKALNDWRARVQLAWGFYCVAAKIDLTFGRKCRITPPAIAPLSALITLNRSRGERPQDSWCPYPFSLDTCPSHQVSVFQAEGRLAQIVAAMLLWREDEESSVSETQSGAVRLWKRLIEWKATLPDELQVNDTRLPSVLLLHITYDSTILKLIEGFSATANLEGQRIDMLRISHGTSIMTAIWIFRSLYTVKHEYWAMQGCFAAAMAMLHFLTPGSVQVDTFAKACQALSEMGECLPLARSFLLAVQGVISQYRIPLPQYGAKYLRNARRPGDMVYTSDVRVSARSLRRDTESDIIEAGEGYMDFSKLVNPDVADIIELD